MEADDGNTASVDQPLALRFPQAFENDPYCHALVEKTMSVRDICNELRKLYARCCGFVHENWKANPGKQPCKGIQDDYNVVCTHSCAGVVFYQAASAASLMGYGEEGDTLLTAYDQLSTEIDHFDFHCRPLYQLSNDGTTSNFTSVAYDHSFAILSQLGLSPVVQIGETQKVQKRLAQQQQIRGEQILALRDAYLQLLGA